MDLRVEALIGMMENLERMERHLLLLVDANDACAVETRASLAESAAQMQTRDRYPRVSGRNNKTFSR